MSAYYNENDPKAAAWLRELIKQGHISDGEVDERSIADVRADDVRGFTQCHFFAGIGGWSYALRLAGWDDARPVWTGSCPCQPFSAAGKGQGTADARHLWPVLFDLIRERRPDVFLGEQVASRDGLGWLDTVWADMEGAGYAFGAVDTCAAGFGAPHIRQRIYIVGQRVADALPAGRAEGWAIAGRGSASGCCASGGLADADGRDAGAEGIQRGGQHGQRAEDAGAGEWLADADQGQCGRIADGEGRQRDGQEAGRQQGHRELEPSGINGHASPVDGHWRDADWLFCRDGKWRPVEPGTFPLAHGLPARVGRLRGYGNAIVAPQAAAFIRAVM